MNFGSIIFELAVIIVGAAALGTLFLYLRQPIIVAYIVLGFAVGPNALGVIRNTEHIEKIGHLGVILLLFLIGLNLQPQRLVHLLRKASVLTLTTSAFYGCVGFLFAAVMGLQARDSVLFGAAMMFSSTVTGLKLIPTTTLHHRRTGEIMTSVLLLQDLLAILVILFITGRAGEGRVITAFGMLGVRFILICLAAFLGVRYVMLPLLRTFDVVQEYTFVATLGWCLLWAETAHRFGLSYEMGAFIAGVSIASCRIALVIAEHLKPLREFFLILFFFSVGARLDLRMDVVLLISAVCFGTILVPLKAAVFRFAFSRSGESAELSRELAVRLAQASEFSLLVVFAAMSVGSMSRTTALMIQIATIASFIVSTYWVVLRYPTPISPRSDLRRD